MSNAFRLCLVSMAVLLAASCSTVVRPTRPASLVVLEGDPLPGVRFDGEETQLREPGMPISPSRSWQREVANYTASALNAAVAADENAPVARTVVTFDLAGPSSLQVGTWKEMTIGLTSTLPDGTIVKSDPVVANIDDGFEYALMTTMSVGGTILDVTAGIASIFFIFQPSFVTGAVFIGALLGGLGLNIAHSTGEYFVAINEERRWSDMYADALRVHARDVRAKIGTGPPRGVSPPVPVQRLPVAPVGGDPSDAPPPLLDPAEPR